MGRKIRKFEDISQIEKIIETAEVCYLSFVDGNVPYIVPMNFGFEKGEPSKLYFHGAREGRKLEIIKKNNNVCFHMNTDRVLVESERPCAFTMQYRSVIGHGKIYIIDDSEEKKHAMNVIMKHYTNRNDFPFNNKMMSVVGMLKLEIESLTGKERQ